jgi:hypothetical protein
MDQLHIADFYKDCAVTLIRLYRSFPRKTSVYVGDLCGFEETDELGLYSQRFQACFAAIQWMIEEGWIRHEGSIGQEAIELATLSQNTFYHLNTAPYPLTNSSDNDLPDVATYSNLADQIHTLLTQGTSDQLNHLMHRFINKLQA